MSEKKKMLPAGNQEHSEKHFEDNPILAPSHEGLVNGCYVAVTQVAGDSERHRRRVYFNLPSAQRIVDRATEKGLDASIVLCKLVPVDGELNG